MTMLARRGLLVSGAALVLATPALALPAPTMEVWKQRFCGCCRAWAAHIEAAGIRTVIHEVDDPASMRAALGVPADLGGCHTARIEGYVVEGHVPAEAVRRLLRERPPILGVAVPGMPVGSPGMEIEGQPAEPYDVVAFAADGTRRIYLPVRPAGGP